MQSFQIGENSVFTVFYIGEETWGLTNKHSTIVLVLWTNGACEIKCRPQIQMVFDGREVWF